jgi:hypothetical protein
VSSGTIFPGWSQTVILQISASQVASHQYPAVTFYSKKESGGGGGREREKRGLGCVTERELEFNPPYYTHTHTHTHTHRLKHILSNDNT